MTQVKSAALFSTISALFIISVLSDCPESEILDCETAFTERQDQVDICRGTGTLRSCISPFSNECKNNDVYARVLLLEERHSFLYCRCPEIMINDFLTAYTESDMCRNRDILLDFVNFFRVPACMRSSKFLSALDLRNQLDDICNQ